MGADVFARTERVLAALLALLVFTLNEVRMFQTLPRTPGEGRAHAAFVHMFGGGEPVYLSAFDVAVRWGLAGLTAALCAWALAETLTRPPPA